MNKPISLRIILFLICINILILFYFLLSNFLTFFQLPSMSIPLYAAIEFYVEYFFILIIFIIQSRVIFIFLTRQKLDKELIVLAWLPICISFIFLAFNDGYWSSWDYFSFNNSNELEIRTLVRYLLCLIAIWLTILLIFSEKIRKYLRLG